MLTTSKTQCDRVASDLSFRPQAAALVTAKCMLICCLLAGCGKYQSCLLLLGCTAQAGPSDCAFVKMMPLHRQAIRLLGPAHSLVTGCILPSNAQLKRKHAT